MPSFTGERRKKYYIAMCTRDALEHLITESTYPPGWDKRRLYRAVGYVFDGDPPAWPEPVEVWHALESYLDNEDRADKYTLLRKFLPF